MTKICTECGEPIKTLPFKCKRCEKYFCDEHRLPEMHNCPFVPLWWHSRGKHTRPVIQQEEIKVVFHTLPTYNDEEDSRIPAVLTQ